MGAGGGARQGRSWRRRGVEYRGREEGGPDQQDRSGISKPTLLPFTGEGARRACPREGGGRMRGASAAKRAFDLRCLDVRVEAKGNSLRSLPSSGALRHLLPQAGEGLGWPGFARGPRFGENRSEEHTSELQSLM